MGATQKNKVTKIQSSYVVEHEKKEKKRAKRKKKAVIRFFSLAVIFAVISSFFVYTLISQSRMIEQKLHKKEQLEKRMEQLEKEGQKLKEEIKKLNDDEYIAELARKKYFLSKEGEIIFTTPND